MSASVTNPYLLSAMRKLPEFTSSTYEEMIHNLRQAQSAKPANKWIIFSMTLARNQVLDQEESYALFDEAGIPTEPVYSSPLESLRAKFDFYRGPGKFEETLNSYPKNKLIPRIFFCQIVEGASAFWISNEEMYAFADACGVPQFTQAELDAIARVPAPNYAPQGV